MSATDAGSFTEAQLAPIVASTSDVLIVRHGAANSFHDAITRAAYNRTWLAAAALAGGKSSFDLIALTWPEPQHNIANVIGDVIDYWHDQHFARHLAYHFGLLLQQLDALRATRQPPTRRRAPSAPRRARACPTCGGWGAISPSTTATTARRTSRIPASSRRTSTNSSIAPERTTTSARCSTRPIARTSTVASHRRCAPTSPPASPAWCRCGRPTTRRPTPTGCSRRSSPLRDLRDDHGTTVRAISAAAWPPRPQPRRCCGLHG
jgi:hypothetical protein